MKGMKGLRRIRRRFKPILALDGYSRLP